ncbi:uncharacterized protein LOC126656864 [Mercurialis annua]|uniref:uncharacterized protein LOC126656864 n=1 Tax=Mercurialis annua TaxID=3986 RepID=UPI00215DE3ED|nr:uncharacterized protein LOC126656864 [Mercurialis annua]
MDKMMELMLKKDAETQQALKNHAATIHNQELQIQQMAKALQNRNQGGLPSTTEENSREHLKAIELRNGKALDDPYATNTSAEVEKEQSKENESEKVVTKPTPLPPYVPKIPFPQRLKKPQDTWKFHQFLDTFKMLQINISLVDALREMPHYAKFLKEIITNKQSWEAEGTIPMTKNCSSIILSNLPTKFRIQGVLLFHVLLVQATPMMFQLADHSSKKPHGIVEDVLVKGLPNDIGETIHDHWQSLIDVHDGKLTLRIGEESVEFDMKKITRHPNIEEKWMQIDMVDEIVQEQLEENNSILNSDWDQDDISSMEVTCECPVADQKTELETTVRTHIRTCANAQLVSSQEEEECEEEPVLEPLVKNKHITPPSSEKPLKMELKTLPAHLRYAFLGADNTLPIIISNKLTKEQEQKVINIVKG